MRHLKYSLLGLSAFVRGTSAWGALGHETVGYIAQEFLTSGALSFVKSSLGSTYNQSLGSAATWADNVRYETAYKWSAPYHFVDAEDDPLDDSCSVSETRDCGDGGCILTAIANYTTRIQETSLSASQRQEALKFIDHFLGDIGQPLHVEAYEVGGNDIDAVCGGKSTNLHAAWDTGILTTNINGSYGGNLQTYIAALVARIKSGEYKSLTSDWLSCTSITEPVSTKRSVATIEEDIKRLGAEKGKRASITPLECPLVWAREANAYDCSVVFSYDSGDDLCEGDYFDNAVPVIDLQLAKQGYRLAAWLNVIFDGETGLP
ncbi:nuclease Le1 [Gloeophyllum trabeum ATCC 11539]|uniref:Nuclease Le1 n=1 Tax=Gloeophyllum trabeum (strain ATCC 11539 / FP-39264 / Madison 617) TaxID=670483 RepID=S7QL48_GLOTA|nr:nuclease Le1 [Gloeophyllum trabeum ATCC 11539]EPQ59993.1 nuclease Le1 [Gloeophyllum trabeum ATCC 11539]